MEPVSMPPARRVSSCFEPVVMEMSSLRRWCISVAVVKPMGTSLVASAMSLSALASEMPLIVRRARLGLCETLAKTSTDIGGWGESVRICNCFYGVVTGFDNGFDVAGTDAIALGGCVSMAAVIRAAESHAPRAVREESELRVLRTEKHLLPGTHLAVLRYS